MMNREQYPQLAEGLDRVAKLQLDIPSRLGYAVARRAEVSAEISEKKCELGMLDAQILALTESLQEVAKNTQDALVVARDEFASFKDPEVKSGPVPAEDLLNKKLNYVSIEELKAKAEESKLEAEELSADEPNT